MILELILFCVFLVLTLCYSKYNSNQKLFNGFDGPKGLPLIGNALDISKGNILERIIPYFAELVAEYGPRVKFFIGWIPNAIVSSPEDIEKILSSSAHIQKGDLYRYLHEWLGQGLITASGEKWHFRRKLLTPSFHYKILEDFVPVIDGQAQQLVSILKSKIDKNGVQIEKELTLASLDIVCETAMGRKVKAQIQSDSPYVRAVNEIAKLIMARPFTPWLIPDFLWKLSYSGKTVSKDIKTIHRFTNSVIKEKMEERSKKLGKENSMISNEFGIKSKSAFLDLLLGIQEGKPGSISIQDMVDDVETFLFAGHDTSTTSLKWSILLLGNHPEVQDKVHKELDEIFGDDKRRVMTMEDVRKMEYLELVIKESLRMYPPVPTVMRQIHTPLHLDGGAVLKPGVTAWIAIYNVHHNPKYWKSPEEFDPERFTVDNSRGRHPYCYIPFSAGPRNCIGQKFAMLVQKIVLANFLREFKVKSVLKMDEIKTAFEIMYLPMQGVKVQLVSRK